MPTSSAGDTRPTLGRTAVASVTAMPPPGRSFEGLDKLDACAGGQCGVGTPPSPDGAAGRSHYIQAVSNAYAIFAKDGTRLAAFTEDQLWSGQGGTPCSGNSNGNGIVLYDAIADRWILTHFASAFNADGDPVTPFFQCIAVSRSGDPVSGGWYFYPVQVDPGDPGTPPVGTSNDYPQFGLWTDCLYMAANGATYPGDVFVGTVFGAFSKSDMYRGAPLHYSLGFIPATGDPINTIPANLTGRAALAVPPGTPEYFVSNSRTTFGYDVRTFRATNNCSSGTMSGPTTVEQAPYARPESLAYAVAQPNTSQVLMSVSDFVLQKVQYRKVSSSESLWVVHDARAAAGAPVSSQWAQIGVTGGIVQTTPVQEGLHSPDAILNRFMGSLAVDRSGNMALGYTTSAATAPNFPSIAYAGRLVSDPLDTLPQSEVQLIAGTGSQVPLPYWGFYSSMSVDPTDDCTFWYTNEYYKNQTDGDNDVWSTRIGSFRFPGCAGPARSDFNADARSDVLWRRSDGVIATWSFTGPNPPEFTAAFLPGAPSSWQAISTGDVNGDGIADIVWLQVSTGTVAVWFMSSPSVVAGAAFPGSVGAGSGWTLGVVADVNGDGYADLVWRNSGTGQLLVWYMSSNGSVQGTRDYGNVPVSYELVSAGDFNSDGIADLLWYQPGTGTVAIWQMSADGTFTGRFPGSAGAGSWHPVRVGDFDGDGHADIFWRNASSGATAVWYLNAGAFVDADFFAGVPNNWSVGTVGDFDRDSRDDLMWQATDTGDVVRWLMRGRHIPPAVQTLQGVGHVWQMVP